MEGSSDCHRGRRPWIPFFLCTFIYFLTFSLKKSVLCDMGRRWAGNWFGGAAYSLQSAELCLSARLCVAGLEQKRLLWPPALTSWNSIPAHLALVKLQDQRSQRSSPSGVPAAWKTSPPRDHLCALSHRLLTTSPGSLLLPFLGSAAC